METNKGYHKGEARKDTKEQIKKGSQQGNQKRTLKKETKQESNNGKQHGNMLVAALSGRKCDPLSTRPPTISHINATPNTQRDANNVPSTYNLSLSWWLRLVAENATM